MLVRKGRKEQAQIEREKERGREKRETVEKEGKFVYQLEKR